MSSVEKNFYYLKGTNIEKYYDDLIKAEYICDDYEQLTKIILRKITEEIIRNIACKHNIECDMGINSLINNIKYNYNINFPEKICDNINIIRTNANNYKNFSNYDMNKNIIKHPIELLKIMDEILKWYLKEVESKPLLETNNFIFKAPSKVNFKANELKKIKNDILLKDRQINNLRMKVLELGNQPKSVIQLNNIIIAIKEEKAYLESKEKLLSKRLQEQENTILEVKCNYNEEIRKFENLQNHCRETESLINSEETKLIKAEIENQELKRMINCLYEQDATILRREIIIKEQLEQLRKTYKIELRFSKEYIDLLNTIEFSYDNKVREALEDQKINAEMQINFENKTFNELINNYEKNIIETKKSVEIYREILKDKVNRGIRYKEVYRGFLNLKGSPLRLMYILSSNVDNNHNLTINFKDSLIKSTKDKFCDYIDQNILKLNNVSDEEIKLILYYRLIKLADVPVKNIYNRKYFIETLDNIVDKSYDISRFNKIPKENNNILRIIRRFFLEKTLINLKNICLSKNIKFEKTLVDNIYEGIKKLNKDQIESIYKNLHIEVLSETIIKKAINDNILGTVSIISSLESIETYELAYNCIFIIFETIEKNDLNLRENIDTTAISEFLNGKFMMNLFIIESKSRFNKFEIKREELLILFIMQIIIGEIGLNNENTNLDSYKKIIDVWKNKQQIYSDIYLKKKDNEENLKMLSLNKRNLENKREELSQGYINLLKEYDNKTCEFFKIVLNSDKIKFLPSYLKYKIFNGKKAESIENTKKTNDKYGFLDYALPEEIWNKHKTNIINNLKLDSVESLLLEEAKESMYFKDEYEVILDLEEKIEGIRILIDKNKKELENQSDLFNTIKNKINEYEKQINVMKERYLDIEEGYWS